MQTLPGKRIALLSVSLVLSACGGGGGGGTVPSGTVVVFTPFTKWSDVQPDSKIRADGTGKQASYTFDPDNQVISKIEAPQDASTSAYFTFDASSVLTVLALTSTTTSTTTSGFAGSEISSLTGDSDFLSAENATSIAVISDPKSLAWDYQSFGVWETGLNSTSRTYGAMSVGAPTTAIPLADGNFTGKVVGSYVNADGIGHTALATLNVGFTGQTLTFSATGTQISRDPATVAFASPPTNLDMAGTLTYVAGTGFAGQLTTVSGLTGDSTGQFYGPNAEELGGTFFLQGPQSTDPTKPTETYLGAYGASR